MKAMILAAGRGERMRPLTDSCPKPLLQVGGKALIEHHIDSLKKANITSLVINHAHLGEQIEDYLGNGEKYGVEIQYSAEHDALETGGGIYKALPLLGNAPFIVVNGDVWCDLDFSLLPKKITGLAHLVMIANPAHNPTGDFYFNEGRLHSDKGSKLTYSGIGVFSPALFAHCTAGRFPLAPLLRNAIAENKVTASYYQGEWVDVGTPERLSDLNDYVNKINTSAVREK